MDIAGNKVRLVVFDFDGTLFDLEVNWRDLRERLGLGEHDSIGDYIADNRGDEDVLSVLSSCELDAAGSRVIDKPIADTLKSIHDNGVDIAILSRNCKEVIKGVLDRSGLGFDIYTISRDDVSKDKPDPEGMENILKHFSVDDRGSVFMVGDTYHDVQLAANSGVKSVIVRNDKINYAPEGADIYIDEVSEMSAIVESI